MNRNLFIGLGVMMAVVVAGIFLIKSPKLENKKPSQGTSSTVQTAPVNIRELTVSAKEFAFTPSVLNLKKNERIRIKLTNDGGMTHNLVVDGMDVSTKNIGPGESDTVEFTPLESGTFAFFCSIGGHRGLGLEGKIIVQ